MRFSDMLGGDGDADDARATPAARDLPVVGDEPPDDDAPPLDEPTSAEAATEPAPPGPSPQDVLDRLTQYATANRSAPPTSEPAPAGAAPSESTPAPTARSNADENTGDDLLPRGKRSLRNPRGKRRDS